MKIQLKAGKHTCLGGFEHEETEGPDEAPKSLERPCMLVYEGDFQSMDGPVSVTEEHLSRLVDNHNSIMSKLKRLKNGSPQLKDTPPLQLDHSTSAMHTVGRVTGPLELKTAMISGEEKKAVFGKVTVLGKENVEKVLDGRWTNVSIGADLEEGKLNELSIVPFPAAQFASLLSGVNKSVKIDDLVIETRKVKPPEDADNFDWFNVVIKIKGDVIKDLGDYESESDAISDAKKVAQNLIDKSKKKLSEGDNMDKEHLKKHLMDKEKMSAEDADKKLAGMDEEALKKLASDVDDEKKKLAAEEEEKKKLAAEEEEKKKLSTDAPSDKEKALASEEKDEKKLAMKAEFVRLAGSFKKKSSEVTLAAKSTKILTRLSVLKSQAKITPAEIKKIDITKLAAANDDTINAVLKSYESREPVIMTGVLSTQKAVNLSRIEKKRSEARLQSETLANMPFTKKATKFAEGMPEVEKEEEKAHIDINVGEAEHMKHLAEVEKLMNEGKMEKAIHHMKCLMEKMKGSASGEALAKAMDEMAGSVGGEVPAKADAQMSALAVSVKELQSDFASLVKLVGAELGIKPEDIE